MFAARGRHPDINAIDAGDPPEACASFSGSRKPSSVWLEMITPMWTSGLPRGASQADGSLAPESPRTSLRAAMPTRNSSGKLSSSSREKAKRAQTLPREHDIHSERPRRLPFGRARDIWQYLTQRALGGRGRIYAVQQVAPWNCSGR